MEMQTLVQFLTESPHVNNEVDYVTINHEELAVTYLPISIFIGIMMCIGLVGNSIAAFIYFFRWGRGSAKYFMGTLAILDLLSSLISMPSELFIYLHPLCFQSDALCKILHYSRVLLSISSGLMLVIIAVDRHRRICKMGHLQFTKKYAKTLCVLSFVIGVIFGSPIIAVYGVSKVTSEAIIWTTTCSSKPSADLQPFSSVYRCFLLFIVVSMIITVVVLYCRIAAKLYYVPLRKGTNPPLPVTWVHNKLYNYKGDTTFFNTINKVSLRNTETFHCPLTEKSLNRSISLGAIDGIRKNLEVRPEPTKRTLASSQMITTFIAITILAIVAYLPNVLLIVFSSLHAKNYPLTSLQQTFFNLGLVSPFLSNGLNPFVYGFFSKKFRGKLVEIVEITVNHIKQILFSDVVL